MTERAYVTASAVTLSDSDTAAATSGQDAFYVGVGGDVKIRMKDDTTDVTFKNMLAGTIYPFRVLRFWDTGTDATDLVTIDDSATYS